MEEHLRTSDEYIFRVNHQGYVKIKGIDEEEIKVTIQVQTTSQTLADGIDISIVNENEITLTVSTN